MKRRFVALAGAVLLFLGVAMAWAVEGRNTLRFAPVAGAGLRVDSTTFVASPHQTVVVDKIVVSGQATSTTASATMYFALRGGTGMPIVLKTVVRTVAFEVNPITSGAWFTREFDGPMPIYPDSPLVFHLMGANTDSLNAMVEYHYAR